MDAEDRIRQIDEGTDLTDIEIIQNPREAIDRAWSHIEKSEYEVLSIFATPNEFRRQMGMGLLQLLKEVTEQRHVQLRILIPGDKQIKDTIDQAAKVCLLVDFRIAEENLQTKTAGIISISYGPEYQLYSIVNNNLVKTVLCKYKETFRGEEDCKCIL